MPVICEGCGRRVPIPEGYRRNKIQCACGVICPVPESARQETEVTAPKRAEAKSSPAIEEETERWLLDDAPPSPPPSEPPRFHDPEPIAETEPMQKPGRRRIDWRFTTDKARIKLKKLYPTIVT